MKLFETIKCIDKNIVNVEYHNERLNLARQELFGCKDSLNIADYIKVPSSKLLKCKVVYADDVIDIEFSHYVKKEIKSLKLVHENNI
ncbi:MAG: branched-chain amino acid aminotransferase, partial [Arcobacteraceae bacterium]